MKLQESATQVITGGLTSPVKQFTINATAKAFSILSSGLYTDKIKAIIRELSCNAYDAHVLAKCADKPFEIHLPNSFEPYFRVTDFGPGLSEEDVYNLYTTYFQSTKTDSNDYIGALGLGSKSPFSYTHSFTVTSRFDGMKKIYSAFLTDEGMPSIVKMSEEPWTGSTGLDVQMSVKSSDSYLFQNDATEVFEYFPVPPIFTGAKVIISKHEYTTKGSGWAFRKGGGQARAIQGVVAYPVPPTNDSQADELLKLGVDLFFEVGELEVAASREALSMNKMTAKNLADRIKLMAKEVGIEVSKTISAAPTFWTAVNLYIELIQNTSVRYALRSIDIKWETMDLIEYFNIKPSEHPTLALYCAEHRSYGKGQAKEYGVGYVNPKDFILIRNDLKRGSRGVLTRWVKLFGENNKKYFLVSPSPSNPEGYDVTADMDDFFNITLGGAPTINLSELKAVLPKIVRGVSIRSTFQVCNPDVYRFRDAWREASNDELDSPILYYIKTYRKIPGQPDVSGMEDRISDVRELFKVKNALVRLGLMDQEDPIFNGSAKMLAEVAKMEQECIDIMTLVKSALVVTDDEKKELKRSAPVDPYDYGLRCPDRGDTLSTVLYKLGINDTNDQIPAIADIKAVYEAFFSVVPLDPKYEVKLNLSNMVGMGETFRLPPSQKIATPALLRVRESFSILDSSFAHNNWATLNQAVRLVEALNHAKMI